MELYHASIEPLTHMVFNPRIPDNKMTQILGEENKTPRICFSKSIHGCLVGLGKSLKGLEINIYKPIKIDTSVIYIPSKEEVFDATESEEVWYLKEIELQYLCKIKVTEPIDLYLSELERTYIGWKWSYCNESDESIKKDGETMDAIHDPLLAEKIRMLSQDEGRNDTEIAEEIGYSRKTVVQIRRLNQIPKCNLNNRRDKPMLCYGCKNPYFVRRGSKIGEEVCPICKPEGKLTATTCI